jgi:hypothetical protein
MPPVQASSGAEQSGANRLSEHPDHGGDGFRPGFVRTANAPVRSRDPWSFARSPGVVSKLELFNLTTFDTTLFIDAVCL